MKGVLADENYVVQMTGRDGFTLIGDEPFELGGRNKGLSPFEYLAAALLSCTAITIKMYLDRKGWTANKIEVHVESDLSFAFKRKIFVEGNFDEKQQQRIMNIANKCPVHLMLERQNQIETEFSVI